MSQHKILVLKTDSSLNALVKESIMVKGVSKTVIVVNNTGSKYFEKVVFYVTPEYGKLSASHLNSAASRFISAYDLSDSQKPTLRSRYKKRKIRRKLGLFLLSLGVLSVILAIIL